LEYSKYGPGMMLFKHLIYTYFQRGLDEVDFSRGDESYKHRLSNKAIYIFEIRVHRSYGDYLLAKLYFKAKEVVLKNRRLRNILSKYKAKLEYKWKYRSLRSRIQ
jgi:hypothetical protein